MIVENKKSVAGLTVNCVVSLILVSLLVYLFSTAVSHTGDDRLFLGSIFFIYLGMLLILSSRLSKKFFLFLYREKFLF